MWVAYFDETNPIIRSLVFIAACKKWKISTLSLTRTFCSVGIRSFFVSGPYGKCTFFFVVVMLLPHFLLFLSPVSSSKTVFFQRFFKWKKDGLHEIRYCCSVVRAFFRAEKMMISGIFFFSPLVAQTRMFV